MANRRWLSFLFLMLSSSVFAAEPLDPASAEALVMTKAVLSDPAKRAESLKDPNAAAADNQLNSLGLSAESRDAAYRISGEILEKWVKESGGNGEALQMKLLEAQRNPAAWALELSPAARESIRKMAEEVPRPVPR